LGQFPFPLWFAQAQLPARLLANVDEIIVVEPMFAGEAYDLLDDLRFRFFV
jgi:hypothetical protein